MQTSQVIHQFMLSQIEKHSIEILKHYPNDVLVHDLNILRQYDGVKGISFAWVVGDMHTHIVVLGIHDEENQNVGYLTHLSSKDRYYLLEIDRNDNFKGKELNRDQFKALATTKVIYQSRYVSDNGFALYQGDLLVANCSTELTGSMFTENVKIGRYMMKKQYPSKLDHAAVHIWLEKRLTKLSGSLFGKYDIQEVVNNQLIAA